MIYSTNRTASIGDIDVDVNESYFGEGSLYFMQEAAQDELALFENAIKTDIDECLIGESAGELEALNEGFVEKTVNKIKELMRKFIEWLKGVTRSALAKLNQFIVRDNATFCKHAEKMIAKMGNNNFKATGKVLAKFELPNLDSVKAKAKEISEKKGDKVDDVTPKIEALEKEIDDILDKLDDEIFEDNKEYTLSDVRAHINFLKSNSKSDLKKLKKSMDEFEKKAKDKSREADKAVRTASSDASEEKKNKLAVEAATASAFKTTSQKIVKKYMTLLKNMIKVARAVVTRAAGNRVNEGVEYSPELIDALIETSNYELDETLEEMSEGGSECDDDDDIEDDEE